MADTVTISGESKGVGKGTIKVKVVDLCKNKPIKKAEAVTSGRKAVSDANGIAELKKLPENKHSVFVTKAFPNEDYITFLFQTPTTFSMTHKAESKKRIEVKLGKGETREVEVKLKVYRLVEKVVFKRLKIAKANDGTEYGHWWVEIDNKESYGWWPKGGVGLKETFMGVEGVLNGEGFFPGGTATRDPHHGEINCDGAYQSVICDTRTDVQIENSEPCNCRSDATIKKEIKAFAKSYVEVYGGRWSWRFDTFGSDNCHIFQIRMMEKCKLDKFKDLIKGKK